MGIEEKKVSSQILGIDVLAEEMVTDLVEKLLLTLTERSEEVGAPVESVFASAGVYLLEAIEGIMTCGKATSRVVSKVLETKYAEVGERAGIFSNVVGLLGL